MLATIIQDTTVMELHKTIEENLAVIKSPKAALEKKDKKIAELVSKVDDLEQYEWRQCMYIFGVTEEAVKVTDNVVIKVAKDVGVVIRVSDIDRCHRVDKKSEDFPRPIIEKFCSYRKRNEVYRLKGTGIMCVSSAA